MKRKLTMLITLKYSLGAVTMQDSLVLEVKLVKQVKVNLTLCQGIAHITLLLK
jgi:hypothetical protein